VGERRIFDSHVVRKLGGAATALPASCELMENVSAMVTEGFQMHSDLKTEARKRLNSYLAASALYGEWRWDRQSVLRRTLQNLITSANGF
jgi:hypothetical protein